MKNEMNEFHSVEAFLESAEIATLEVKRLQRRLAELTQRQGDLRPRKDAAARRLIRMIDAACKREAELVSRELEVYRSVEEFVARVPGRTNRMILRRRYLEPGLNWTEVRDLLEKDGVIYSMRQLTRLHTQAMEEARKLWETEGEEGAVKKRR